MNSFTAGQDVTVAVPLTRGGDPFVPDGNTVTVTVRGHDGAILSSAGQNGVTDSTLLVLVAAAQNAIAKTVEKRTLIVEGMAGGLPFSIRTNYLLTAFLNYIVEPSDVRTFLGVDEGELPDAEIDLDKAYLHLAPLVDLDTLNAAFVTDPVEANDAVLAQAVIDLMPSLQARISMMDTDGTSKAQRFPLDLAALEGQARDLRAKSIIAITSPPAVTPSLVAFSTRPDPFTG